MCQVPSWIKTKDAVLFLTDKDVLAHKIEWNDATGHSAIRRVWPKASGVAGEGIGKDTPKEVLDALKSGEMNRIVEAGELLIREGKFESKMIVRAGNIEAKKGATLTLPALTKAGDVRAYQGATLTLPALTTAGYVIAQQGATLTLPALTEVARYVIAYQGVTLTLPALTKAGDVRAQQGATLTLPALTKAGDVITYGNGKIDAPKLKKKK